MVKDLSLPGLKLVELKIYRDDRGFFTERFVESRFREFGIHGPFIQDNHSRSKPGVIRGLHYQVNPSQGKLVGVVRGKIWDVVVDLRQGSSTYGKWEGVELSDENGRLLWVPAGFAHGFCVLGNDDADVMYKVNAPYSPSTEGGIRFDDSDLKIAWPVLGTETVSPKDRILPTFKEYALKPVF